MIAFADNFQAGAVLTLVIPITLLIVLVIWYLRAVNHIPADTPESSAALPHPDVVKAAGETVSEVTPMDPGAGPV